MSSSSSSSFPLPRSDSIRAWLLISSAAMMMGWARVARTLFRHWHVLVTTNTTTSSTIMNDICVGTLTNQVHLALQLSFLEVFNAMAGITRSKWQYVLLFAVVRYGMEVYFAPTFLHCQAWQHIMTVLCWSVGDGIRFYCFVVDTLVPNEIWAKYVRYTVGPLIFPVGAAGEFLMVIEAARKNPAMPHLYIVAALWPLFFAPLFQQLLRQRRKFMASIKKRD